MPHESYKKWAGRLDVLPNGYPATEDGAELRLLEYLAMPEEAALAAELRLTLETPQQIADRLGGDAKELKTMLKGMLRKGLINAGKAETGVGYGLLPFVVGIYEMQIGRIDAELAKLFEDYYQTAYSRVLSMEPAVHRVIPVNQTIKTDLEVRPYESATDIVNGANAWGVMDCICRKQKSLIGDPCSHPIEDTCMIFSQRPGAFDGNEVIKALTQEEAHAALKRAADAGLVHSVSNTQEGLHYVCNCCTCSCGVLRGMAEMGMANVVARSAFVNQVDPALCQGCETCIDYCQFDALSLGEEFVIEVSGLRCVGCGVCVPACPDEALVLVRRPEEELRPVPPRESDWMQQRAIARGLDLAEVL